jgi:hypothetical protein
VVPNNSGSSVWNLLNVALPAPRILRQLPDFWKICAPLAQSVHKVIVEAQMSMMNVTIIFTQCIACAITVNTESLTLVVDSFSIY